jgi:hypothetical protein
MSATTTDRPSERLVMNAQVTLAGLLRKHLYDYDRTAQTWPESLPTEALHYGSPADFIREARYYGHFFDESTMRTFKTRTYELINERFLVISDKSDWGPREYRVVWIYRHKPTCDNANHIHKSVQPTETRFRSLAQARKFAHDIAGLIKLIESA